MEQSPTQDPFWLFGHVYRMHMLKRRRWRCCGLHAWTVEALRVLPTASAHAEGQSGIWARLVNNEIILDPLVTPRSHPHTAQHGRITAQRGAPG